MASDVSATRHRVLTYVGTLFGGILACVALFHAVARTDVPLRVLGALQRGSGGGVGAERGAVALPSGVDTRRLGRFPRLQRDPPPRDGVLYRSAGEGDHVVINGADLLMYATMGSDGSRWEQHKPILTLGSLTVKNLKWIVDEALKRHILMFNSKSKKQPEITSVSWIHTFPGFIEAKKKHAGWSNIQDMPSLKGCLLSSPPLRGLKSGLILPVHELGNDTDLLKWSLAEDGKEGVRWVEVGAVMTGQFSRKASRPTVVRLLDSRGHPSRYLVALFQSHGKAHVWRAVSNNDGRSWSAAERTKLPSPDTQVQAITLRSGAIALLFHNNAGDVAEADRRQWPLSIALSEDGGLTWPWVRDLLEDFDPRLVYTSPSMVQSPDGQIHIVFSVPHLKTIRYQQVSENWIKGQYVWGGSTRGVYVCEDPMIGSCWTRRAKANILS